jgi:hypothetical protein
MKYKNKIILSKEAFPQHRNNQQNEEKITMSGERIF